MDTYTLAVSAAALALFAAGPSGTAPTAQFSQARMFIEYDPSVGLASMIVEAESEESFDRVDIRNTRGAVVMRMQTGGGQPLVLSGFSMETPSTTLSLLERTFEQGPYVIRGRAAGGHRFSGIADFLHALPAEPIVLHPPDGAKGVPTTNLVVSWIADPSVAEYRVGLEQGESDGLRIVLPGSSNSFQVPNGYLQPGTETHLEIAAVGDNGNRMLGQVTFTTR